MLHRDCMNIRNNVEFDDIYIKQKMVSDTRWKRNEITKQTLSVRLKTNPNTSPVVYFLEV